MPIRIDDLSKLETSSIPGDHTIDFDKVLTAILKVTSADYVPKNVIVRSRIGPCIMTCEFMGSVLAELENDEKVVSISLEQAMHRQVRRPFG